MKETYKIIGHLYNLKSNIKTTNGNGTKDNPYILSIE